MKSLMAPRFGIHATSDLAINSPVFLMARADYGAALTFARPLPRSAPRVDSFEWRQRLLLLRGRVVPDRGELFQSRRGTAARWYSGWNSPSIRRARFFL